ncbi:MAG: biotin synthase BioB [Alphaproteobacteria bacterium]
MATALSTILPKADHHTDSPESRLKEKALTLYALPLFDLLWQAQNVHRQHHEGQHVQRCSLLSIKTGSCPEDCSYCPQSAHYKTGLDKQGLIPLDDVKAAAQKAKNEGAERFCMGAAWRQVKDGKEFDQVLEMVKIVKNLGMEACATLGMITTEQAKKLKDAGLDAYNHNLDTSREYYSNIITTRDYDDRLNTLKAAREAGITLCSGGIIGMGESIEDRCGMLATLAALEPQPESVPINLLIPVEGTPLADSPPVPVMELVRLIAVARLLLPQSRVRLSAGRINLSDEAQILAFLAGANSIFLGDKLLTRPNPDHSSDESLLSLLEAIPLESLKKSDAATATN